VTGPVRQLVEDGDRGVALDVAVAGDHPRVVMMPAAMRGAADFAAIQTGLLAAGHGSVAISLRGAERSRGPLDSLTLEDLAEDVVAVVDALCASPVHLVGHALGNVIARAAAHHRPDIVATVALMPCGGGPAPVARETPPDVQAALAECADPALPVERRRRAIGLVFFAPGNDPVPWLDGWWPHTLAAARAIVRAPSDEWAQAGSAPVLVLQAAHDALFPPDVGRAAADALFGDRATYHEIPGAGHALLPERPDLVVDHVAAFLAGHPA
jgi:pimeloyl-ACP methyl ester carboxylesterase